MLEALGTALTNADAAAASATLDDDVVLRVAVHDRPFHGAAAAGAILTAVLDGPLHDIRPGPARSARTDEADPAPIGVLTFTAGVLGYDGRADGLLLTRPASDGRLADVTVHLRPLAALGALAEEMGRRTAPDARPGQPG